MSVGSDDSLSDVKVLYVIYCKSFSSKWQEKVQYLMISRPSVKKTDPRATSMVLSKSVLRVLMRQR